MKPSLFSGHAVNGARKRLFPSSSHSRTPSSSNFDSNLSSYDFEDNNNTTDNQLYFFDEDSGWNISFDNIHLLEKIAQGAFGVVYKAHMEGAKGTVAVKVQDVLDSDTEEQINLLVELSISKFFSHENIVRCLGVGRTQTLASEQNVKAKVFIVMEYHERGTLREILHCKLSWHDKIMLARDIANGLMYIHEKKLIHRSSSKSQYTYGTDEFMSPEIALATDYDTASDIFSFGIVICEIITGIPPSKTFMCRQPRNTFSLDEEEVGRNVPLDCPEGLEALAYQCCDVDPKKRPTASMCVEELELIAIEWRIDEHENKSRARALSFSGGSPGKATTATATATGTAAAFAERSNEAFQNSQMIDEEQKEISQLYTDITNKLTTIELCDAVESSISEDLQLSSESKDSFNQSGQQQLQQQQGKEFVLDVEPDVAFNERTIIDSHIEDKLKPMLQTMLGRLESIEQNLNKTSQANNHHAAATPTHTPTPPPNSSMYVASSSSQELLKQDAHPHSEEVYKIMTLQSQIDELKAAMMSMAQGSSAVADNAVGSFSASSKAVHTYHSSSSSSSSSKNEVELSKPASPLSKPSGKWNAFFEDMQSKAECEKKSSIEFNEVHVMNRHHRQASDDVSVHSSSAELAADSQQDSRDNNKLQIVEHLAYTVDKQPIHVREKIYHDQNRNASEAAGGGRKGRSREDRKKDKTNRANEQLSKALGSFLDVISRCNQTSATVMDAMNATDSATGFGGKSPVVPSVHYIPIGASSPPSPPQSSSAGDFDPQYRHHSHSYSEVPPQGGMPIDANSYDDYDYNNGNNNNNNNSNEEALPQVQYSQRIHHGMLDRSNRSSSAHLPFEASERIQKQKQHAQRRGDHQQQQLQRSQSFRSPPLSSSKRVNATNSNGRQRGGNANTTPHYAMATKTSVSAQSSPRPASASQRSVSSMNTNTNSDSNSNSNTPNRLRSKSPNKESLSTRKSPFSYSFPSDSKPRLGFELTSNSRLRSPPTREREMPQTFNSSAKPVKTGGGSAMPLSTVLNRR